MKLYNAPRNSWVRPVNDEPTSPPGAQPVNIREAVKFHHIDGMYSYCHDKDGNVVHLPAWQNVEVVEDDR